MQEPGSYVGEVIKVMGKKKVLCKVRTEVGVVVQKVGLAGSWGKPVWSLLSGMQQCRVQYTLESRTLLASGASGGEVCGRR